MKKQFLFTCLFTLLVFGCQQKKETTTEVTETTQAPTDSAVVKDTVSVPAPPENRLSKVIGFEGLQVTGVTVSDSGRMFANFPRWRKDVPFSVIEIMPDGTYKPFPDSVWNAWTGKPMPRRFTCIQSVIAHGNSLFVLDPANPEFQGVLGTAMLYEFDLNTNKLKNSWSFDKKIAPARSYLNDLRVDDKHGKIYITDSGLGAIVVFDPKTRKSNRMLANHQSTKSEKIVLKFEGNEWYQHGAPPRIHSDGIALSPDNEYLYFHALTGYTLYRVPTQALAAGNDAAAAELVENLGQTPAPDGMIFDKSGNLYMGDLENHAVVYRTPDGEIKTLIRDPDLKWPDTFTFDREGNLLVSASHIYEAKEYIDELEFEIFKITLPENKPATP